MVTKKHVTCLEPEVDSQNCAEFCSAPLWSDWVKVNECKMVRFCETKGWYQKFTWMRRRMGYCVGYLRSKKLRRKGVRPALDHPRKKFHARWQHFAERKFSCPMSVPVSCRSNQENNSKSAKFDPLGALRLSGGARVIFEFKISLEMVAKSRSRTSSFGKRARFRLGNMLRSNGR